MSTEELPLLPLVLADVPAALVRALGQEGIPVRSLDEEPKAGRFVLFDSRTSRTVDSAEGQTPIDIATLRSGFTEDPFVLLDDESARRCRWRIGTLDVSETVSRVDKLAVRQALLSRLREAIETAGGVWLRLATFPAPYRSAFNFRIDYDDYVEQDFQATLSAVAGHEGAFSHYVCGSNYEGQPEALALLKEFDVGSHGYHHHTYPDFADNLENIRRGIEVLRRSGIDPVGFAAPHGRFNRGLLRALETLGVTHSSEFGLAYDEVPFFPEGSSVLQVPVHPICLGICLEAVDPNQTDQLDAAAAASLSHLHYVAWTRYRSGEPVFFYGHPTRRLGRYPHLIRGLLDTIKRFDSVWKTTLSEFAAWWRARNDVRWKVTGRKGDFVITVERPAGNYPLAIEFMLGDLVATVPLVGRVTRFSSTSLDYERRKPPTAHSLLRFDASEGLRARAVRLLDWEKATPLDEINTGTWRGRLKKTLRRLRA